MNAHRVQATSPFGDPKASPNGLVSYSIRRFRIALVLLAIAAAVLYATSKVGGIATVHQPDKTVYRHSVATWSLSAVSGLLLCSSAVFAMRSRIWPGYFLALATSILGAGLLAVGSPTIAQAKVVLTDNHFNVPMRGFWWTPPSEIPLVDLSAIWIQTDENGNQNVLFVLRSNTSPVEAPMNDLLSADMPEIRARAQVRGAPTIDPFD